jgi:hypothetical protein
MNENDDLIYYFHRNKTDTFFNQISMVQKVIYRTLHILLKDIDSKRE